MKSPLTEIPGVGDRTASVMEALGIRELSDLRGRDPEELYVWRAAVYYAEHEDRDPEKLKWWYWKDKTYPEEEGL